MPIFSEFYACLRRGAGSAVDRDDTPTGFSMLAKGMNMRGMPVTDEARVSFFKAFDITPDEQLAVEKFYRDARPTWREPLMNGHCVQSALRAVMGSRP